MVTQNYLALRLVRLTPTNEWFNNKTDLSFVFLQSGKGKYVSTSVTRQVVGGDVLVLNGTSGGKLCISNGGDLAFCCFSVPLEHLFPLFEINEISLLPDIMENFNGTKLYPASTPLAQKCHQLIADAPPPFDLDHRSQLLRIVASILTMEFRSGYFQRGGGIRIEAHKIQVFEKLSAERSEERL